MTTNTEPEVVPDADVELIEQDNLPAVIPYTIRPLSDGEGGDMLDHLRMIVMKLAEAVPEYAGDPVSLGAAAARLEALAADLRFVVDMVKREAAKAMPDKKLTIEGVCLIERVTSGSKTVWEDDKLVARVVRDAWNAGEINHPDDVAMLLRTVSSQWYWRKTALRDRGIDPDEYSDTTYGHPSIKIMNNAYRQMEQKK